MVSGMGMKAGDAVRRSSVNELDLDAVLTGDWERGLLSSISADELLLKRVVSLTAGSSAGNACSPLIFLEK